MMSMIHNKFKMKLIKLNMCEWLMCILVFLFVMIGKASSDYNPSMDSVPFKIDWPGSVFSSSREAEVENSDLAATESELLNGENKVILLTPNKEKYSCILPSVDTDSNVDLLASYSGLSELELLQPLYQQTSCSYRIESYWTYELCHGRHLRQYHEEKEPGKKTKLQEYFLGRLRAKTEALDDVKTTGEAEAEEKAESKNKKIAVQKVDGLELPYFAVQYEDGTPCDLTGMPRRASMHYVCQPEGKGEVYELKETSTCEYEVVVLTSLLCKHPIYKPKGEVTNTIQCVPLEGSPDRPKDLKSLEDEFEYGKYNRKEPAADKDDPAADKDDLWDLEGRPLDNKVLEELQLDSEVKQFKQKSTHSYYQKKTPSSGTDTRKTTDTVTRKVTVGESTKQQLLKEFLRGEQCLRGGTGWWKHELCYGKYVKQYHEDRNGKMEVLLGVWNTEAHKTFMDDKTVKQPKPKSERNRLYHYYSGGDFCEAVGKYRITEVKLKCKSDEEQQGMIIYLTEPKTCEYVLTVESSMLCSVIQNADDHYGLIEYTNL